MESVSTGHVVGWWEVVETLSDRQRQNDDPKLKAKAEEGLQQYYHTW